jgi:chromosome segregation ATPase
MSRKVALLGAGILTGIIMIVLFMLSALNDVEANEEPEIQPVDLLETNTETETDKQPFEEYEAALAEREAELQNQLSKRQEAVKDLDETYQTQFTVLEDQLEEINSQVSVASERVEALKIEGEKIQEEIIATDEAFQEEMTGLQNSLSYQDSQIRQEIESVNAQLQQTYDQIAAKEAAAMSNSGSSNSNGHHDGDHDDDDDHDDDHEEHDDD